MKKHHDKIDSIDMIAYYSKLNAVNPMFKFIITLLILIICIAMNDIFVSLYVIASCLLVSVMIGKIGLKIYMNMLLIPIGFLVMACLPMAFEIVREPVYNKTAFFWQIKICSLYIYTDYFMIHKCCNLLFKSLGAVSSLYMLTLSTPVSEIITVIDRLKVPKILTELMNMIYRYIFILMEVQHKMTNSAQSRLGFVDYKTSIKTFGNILCNLLIVSLKKADMYYNALESRCYDGSLVFLQEDKNLKTVHVICGAMYIAVMILIFMS